MLQGPIAQLAEHRADNAGVSGSIPLGPTRWRMADSELLMVRKD